MNITINENLVATLEKLASDRGQTTEVYATEYLEAHLLSKYKEHMAARVTSQKLEDIKTIEVEVAKVEEAIAIRDEFVPVEVITTKVIA